LSPRARRRSSVQSHLDQIRDLEDEKKKVGELEQWKISHLGEEDVLRNELKKVEENAKLESTSRQMIQHELDDIKSKLEKVEEELAPFKLEKSPKEDDKHRARSWNRKLIGNMHDISSQLDHEVTQRKELEKFKAEFEAQMEETKRKVREEKEARIRLEESCKRLQREIRDLQV